MVRIPTYKEPTHPGGMLLEEFLEPMGGKAKAVSVSGTDAVLLLQAHYVTL